VSCAKCRGWTVPAKRRLNDLGTSKAEVKSTVCWLFQPLCNPSVSSHGPLRELTAVWDPGTPARTATTTTTTTTTTTSNNTHDSLEFYRLRLNPNSPRTFCLNFWSHERKLPTPLIGLATCVSETRWRRLIGSGRSKWRRWSESWCQWCYCVFSPITVSMAGRNSFRFPLYGNV